MMTTHIDSHITTDVRPEMLLGVQTGNRISYDVYNTGSIIKTSW